MLAASQSELLCIARFYSYLIIVVSDEIVFWSDMFPSTSVTVGASLEIFLCNAE